MVFIEQVLSTINAISESLFCLMMTMIQNADYDDIVEFIALFLTLTIIFFFHFFFLYFAIRLTYGFEQTLLGFINATLAQIRFYRTTREIFQRLKTTSANEMSKKNILVTSLLVTTKNWRKMDARKRMEYKIYGPPQNRAI